MFGLNIRVAALLFNIIVVQGNVFRKEKFLQDANHVEHYQTTYTDSEQETDFDVGPELPKFEPLYDPSFDYGHFGKIIPDWFPKLPNPEYMGPIGPIISVPHPTRPDGSNDQGSVSEIKLDRNGKPVYQQRPGYPNKPWWPKFQGSRFRRSTHNHEPPNRMIREFKRIEKSEELPTTARICLEMCDALHRGIEVFNDHPTTQKLCNLPLGHDINTACFCKMYDEDTQVWVTYIGGRATDLHQLPWTAHLVINPRLPGLHSPDSCGGTIISSRYVVTAAHCLYNTFKDLSQLEVFLAEYDTDTYSEDCIVQDGKKECIQNKVMTVDHVILHKDYNDTYLQNDIALLRLSDDIPYTRFIRPICLPTSDIEDLQKEVIVIAGWGLNGKTESHLKQAAFVKFVSNDKCKEQYSYKDDSMFCSIGDHGEDICKGDSGGPLMTVVNNQYYLSGIVSGKRKDHGCGSSVASLFNNVFYHKDWIAKNVEGFVQ